MRKKKKGCQPSSGRGREAPVQGAVASDEIRSKPDETPTGPPDRSTKRGAARPRRWPRRLLWACIIAVALTVVLRIALWASLPWILDKTMSRYGLDARYERLGLSLLTGDAELWHLVLTPTDGNTPLTDIEYCRADVSLTTLLTRRLVVHRLEIDGMDISVTRAQDGTFPQLRTLLAVLGKHGVATPPAANDEPASSSGLPREVDLRPPLRIDALRLQHVQLRFRDEVVAPAFETRLDLNVRLSDLGSQKRHTRFQVMLSSPPVLDQFLIEGTGSANGKDLLADIQVALKGMHPHAVTDYLAALGLVPDASDLGFACSTSVRIQQIAATDANAVDDGGGQVVSSSETASLPLPQTLEIHLEAKNATVTADGVEHFSLNEVAVDANLAESGALRVRQVRVQGGAFHAWRRPSGTLSVGGFGLVGRPQPVGAAGQRATQTADLMSQEDVGALRSTDASAAAWSVDSVEFRDIQFVLHDESVSPKTDLALDLKEVAIEDAASESGGLTLTARLGAPGIVEDLQASGAMVLSSTRSRAELKISGAGIRPEVLRPHLELLGLESLYRSGTFTCDVNAALAQRDTGLIEASAFVTNISLTDTDELFGLRTIGIGGIRIDPNSGTTHVDQVEISGQRLGLGRDEAGYLTALGFRLTGNASGSQSQPGDVSARPNDTEATPDVTTASPVGPAARVEIGRISWRENEMTFVDRMVTPAKTIVVSDVGFEVADVVLGGESGSATPASVTAWLRSPGIIDRAEVTGAVTPDSNGLSFDLSVRGQGLALAELSPYLSTVGAESSMVEGSVAAQTSGRVTWDQGGLVGSVAVRDATVKDGDTELAGFDLIDIAQLSLADKAVEIERVAVEHPRLMLSRDESGALDCVGLRIIPQHDGGPTAVSEPAVSKPASPVRVGQLEVKDARIQWADDAVVPAVSQSVAIDLTLDNLALGIEAPPATVTAKVRAPGMVQQATVSGQIQSTPSTQNADLTLDATGVDLVLLQSYLPAGVVPVLQDGQLHAHISGEATPNAEGGRRILVSMNDVDYRSGSNEEPFLRFDSAELSLERLDPNAQVVSIQDISLRGLEATLERKTSGAMSLMGFDVGALEPVTAGVDSAVNERPEIVAPVADGQREASSIPSGQAGRTIAAVRKTQRLPLITLEQLSLEASRLVLKQPAAAPIVISNLHLANTEAIELLGDESDLNPPVKITVEGQIQPLAESAQLQLEMSPFAAQPRVRAEWNIEQIRGSGLTSILPELSSAIDANGLRSGRLSGTAELTLQVERRNVAGFEFDRPFGLELLAEHVIFSDTETETVLAGLEELRAVIPRVDPNSGSIYVREIGLVRPQGIVSKEADGVHLLGMILKTPAETTADSNAVAALTVADAEDETFVPADGSQGQDEQLDLRVDQFLVNGIDFSYVDNTVEPPMHAPLAGLDVEVRGFATPAADVREPMRFNIIASAGEVALPQRRPAASADDESAETLSSEASTTVNRLLFQEMSASGRLTLYPQPDGWVKTGLSGLELVNFRGLAQQQGMTLRDGVFDGSVDMRFHAEEPVSTRTRLVFTDLSLTEPPDGFLAQLLALPTSLDTVLFILEDAGGSIRLPLSFKVDEDGLSSGQVTQAAVGAAATLIATAVAGSPLRVAGSIGNLLGGGAEESSGAETHVVQFDPAVTVLSERQTWELAAIAERLRRERDLSVTVRHRLGGGDIEKATALVNLSSAQTSELLAKLRQERSELEQAREVLSGEARAAFAAGFHATAAVEAKRLQEVEMRIGLIERSLDDLLETLRPGSDYAARRRTQNACVAIGKARVETLAGLLLTEGIPEGSERITFIPPRFAEVSDSAGGSITLTLSKSKAR